MYISTNNTAVYNLVEGASNGADSIVTLDLTVNQPSSSGALHTNSTTDRRTQVYSDDDDTDTFRLTRELLGKSVALGELSKSKVKGRPGARSTHDLLFQDHESSTLGEPWTSI